MTNYRGRAKLCAVLPRVWRNGDEAVFRKILETTPALSAVSIGNAGHMAIVEGLPLEKRGDFGLNVFNSRAVDFWRQHSAAFDMVLVTADGRLLYTPGLADCFNKTEGSGYDDQCLTA